MVKPLGGGHQGSTLDVRARITYTYVPEENAGDVTRVRIIYAGDEILNTTGPFDFYPPDPNNGNVICCDLGEMGDGHGKASPGNYTVTVIVTITTMYGYISGYDEFGEPIWDYYFVDTQISDAQTFGLDNKTPVAITRDSPTSPATGAVLIDSTVVPAPAAGAGIWDDFMDRVEYEAGAYKTDLTKEPGHYDEFGEWVESYRWTGGWDTAAQFDPQNAPDEPQKWGDPKWPDGTYQQKVTAYFGPNTKVGGEGALELKNKGKLSGTVKDQRTGAPINGATVKAIRYDRVFGTATTDENGNWEIELYPGAYALEVTHRGHLIAGGGASLWPGQTVGGIEISMEKPTLSFSIAPVYLSFGGSTTIQVSSTPDITSELTFSSGNPDVATVSWTPPDLRIEAGAPGTAEIGGSWEDEPAGGVTVQVVKVDLQSPGLAEDDEETKGVFLHPNDDDDNGNGIADMNDTGGTTGENDLLPLDISVAPANVYAVVDLSVTGPVRVWLDPNRTTLAAEQWPAVDAPTRVYLEALGPPSAAPRDIQILLSYVSADHVFEDRIAATIIGFELREVHFGAGHRIWRDNGLYESPPGAPYETPQWTSGGVSKPICYTRSTAPQLTNITLDIIPEGAGASIAAKIRAVARQAGAQAGGPPRATLTYELQRTFGIYVNGPGPTLVAGPDAQLAGCVDNTKLDITWDVSYDGGQSYSPAFATTSNDLLVTCGPPGSENPDDYNFPVLTRVKKVTEVARGLTDEADIVRHLRDGVAYMPYTPNWRLLGREWALLDGEAGECIDIARLHMKATRMVGLTTGQVVIVFPDRGPAVAGRETVNTGQELFDFTQRTCTPGQEGHTQEHVQHSAANTKETLCFLDAAEVLNRLEACFKHGGKYYPGGIVGNPKDTPAQVMQATNGNDSRARWYWVVGGGGESACAQPGPDPEWPR